MSWVGYAVVAYALVTWVLPMPLTLLHELGHALPLLAFSRDLVVVKVGGSPRRKLSLGRLLLEVRLLNRRRWGWFGNVEAPDAEPLSRGRMLIVLDGGPLVSALLLTAFLVAAALVPWQPVLVVWAGVIAVAWQLLVTAIPMRYPRWFGPYAGRVSDGYRISHLFRVS